MHQETTLIGEYITIATIMCNVTCYARLVDVVIFSIFSIGLEDREEGDLGPIYGFQWRHFGARFVTNYCSLGSVG